MAICQAHKAVIEELLLKQSGLQVGKRAYGKINAAGIKVTARMLGQVAGLGGSRLSLPLMNCCLLCASV